jgi:MSHA biogenesis protein MshN
MSVINKMLRDLDQQQHQRNHSGLVFKPKPKANLLLWGAVPLALCAGWGGQLWYNSYVSGQPESAVTAAKPEKTPVDAVAVINELLPAAKNQAAQSSATVAQTEQVVTLQDVVADRISPEVAARLGKTTSVEPAQVADTELKPFASQPVAEERVVEVVLAEPEEVFANQSAAAEQVQVSAFEQSGDFTDASDSGDETDWQQEPQVQDKPRTLAIEKVQLTPQQQKDLFRQKAQKAEGKGDLLQSIEYWQQIRQLAPAESEAYIELSRLAQIQRKDQDAVLILEQALATGVQDPKLSMALAALALKQQDWAKALSYLQYEPDIFNYVDFYALKAAALQKTNQHPQAVQVFQQLARQQPDQARWWLGMALSYDALQQPAQALLAYRQATVNGQTLSAGSLDYVKKRIAALE